ncbi:hypothetical protein D9757_000669 [Collybiopsis confluens]|uniref:Ribosomal RNA-processing protein 42 n=1 Tax=Collybiopsis confluens TaxID=2823264 RepID=A0A8H5MGS8_9AGAR|nr:hypothetical protein D9757_000669 [Collybiopsis confluens]
MASTSISKAEKSYIQAGLLANPPRRADGRSLRDFRPISLETGVAPLSNGSARVNIGRNPHDGSGGTEIIATVKLEVGNAVDDDGLSCTVVCSPSAYPHLSSGALDDLQHDLTTVLHSTLSHPSLRPKNLEIIPGKKLWSLNLDLLVMADAGNIYDALFIAARVALWDTKVPRTRSVEYKNPKTLSLASENMDVDRDTSSGFDTRKVSNAVDFELPDYWDEGQVLDGRERWPIAITLNLAPSVHFVDATLQEEASCASRILAAYSYETPTEPTIQCLRMFGSGELNVLGVKALIKASLLLGRIPSVLNILGRRQKSTQLR